MSRWLAVVGVLAALVASGCDPLDPDPTPNPTKTEGAQYEYAPTEQSITWTPQKDGSLTAVHRFLIDAGAGKPADQTVSGYVAPIRLRVSKGYASSWSTTPSLHEVRATDRTGSGSASQLDVTTAPSEHDERSTRVQLRPVKGWSKGRHLIEVTYRWKGVWVTLAGEQLMVLPHMRLSAPWYNVNDDSETMRLRLADRTTILCRGDNPNYSKNRTPKDEPCAHQMDGEVATQGRFSGLGSVSANNVYYYVRTPAGFTAQPTTVKEQQK